GDFTVQEAKDLANILKAGKLPASADIVSSEVIGPSLGQAAIDAGLLSSVVGLILVAAWMVFYYGKAGWYANIAVMVNLLFLFGILSSLGAVLTIPGIAGVVVTLGTAVDAKLSLFALPKVELRHGKALNDASTSSVSWLGSMGPSVDANVTHILAG